MHVFQPYTEEAQFISICSYSPIVAYRRLKKAKESYSHLGKYEHSDVQSHPQCHGRWTAFIVMRTQYKPQEWTGVYEAHDWLRKRFVFPISRQK